MLYQVLQKCYFLSVFINIYLDARIILKSTTYSTSTHNRNENLHVFQDFILNESNSALFSKATDNVTLLRKLGSKCGNLTGERIAFHRGTHC